MSKRMFVCMLVAVMSIGILLMPVNAQVKFTDVPVTHWAYEYISKLVADGIIKGLTPTTYGPERNLTRAEYATLISGAKKLTIIKPATPTFADVPPTHWAYGFVEAAVKSGYLKGYPDKSFKPNNPITRAEMAAVAVKARGIEKEAEGVKDLIALANDEEAVPAWAKGIITVAYRPLYQFLNYRTGRMVAANALANRAEAALIIFRLSYPPKMGGTLTIDIHQEPATLFGMLDSMSAMYQVLGSIYDTTIPSDWRGEMWPQMDKVRPTLENGKWVVYPSGKEPEITLVTGKKAKPTMKIDYELRPNLKWADGKLVTNKDVVFGTILYLIKDMPVASTDPYDKLLRIELVGDYKISTYWRKNTYWPQFGLPLYPKHWFETNVFKRTVDIPVTTDFDLFIDSDGSYLAEKSVIGNKALFDYLNSQGNAIQTSAYNDVPMNIGPYKFSKWVRGSHIELVPDPNYFMGRGLFDKVIYRFLETEGALVGIISKTLDMSLIGFSDDHAKVLRERPVKGVKVVSMPSVYWEHWTINYDDPKKLPDDPKPGTPYNHPLFKYTALRKALSYAIDRKAVSNLVFYGGREPCGGYALFSTAAQNAEVIKDATLYDPVKAEKTLADAGFKKTGGIWHTPEGVKVDFTVTTTVRADRRTQLEVIKEQLAKVGIIMRFEQVSGAILFGTLTPSRQFDIAHFAWGQNTIVEPGGYTLYHSSAIPSKANGWQGQNYSGWRNTEADKLAEIFNEDLNAKNRNDAYFKHQVFWNRDVPELPLLWWSAHTALQENLKGYDVGIDVGTHTWNIMYWYRE